MDKEQDQLREQFAALVRQAEENEQVLYRYQARELALLGSEDFPALLDALTNGLRQSFGVDQATAVLWDPQHELRHLLQVAGNATEAPDTVYFAESLSGLSPLYSSLVRPWVGAYSGADHGLLGAGAGMASIAVIPLQRDGRLLGSVNLFSADPSRFKPNQATHFLQHLGAIASFALENAVNRSRLTRSGYTDVLTGWHNRRYLKKRLQDELARAGREQTPLACLMLDLDHFKSINDRWGHLAGDAVLVEIAHRIEEQIRRSDIAARYGGEEFVIVLPNTTADVAMIIAERIRQAVASEPVSLGEADAASVSVSIGLSSLLPDQELRDLKSQAEALVAEADLKLYRAKAGGRDRVYA